MTAQPIATLGFQIPTIEVSDTQLLVGLPFPLFRDICPDPLPSETRRGVINATPDLRRYYSDRLAVQRQFGGKSGAKHRNLRSLTRYLALGLKNGEPFFLPPLTLWSRAALEVHQGSVTLHFGMLMPQIDGDTRAAALHAVYRDHEEWGIPAATIEQLTVPAWIHHGVDLKVAQQGFVDLNGFAAKAKPAEIAPRDGRDPIMILTRRVMDQIIEHPETGDDVLVADLIKESGSLTVRDKEWLRLVDLRALVLYIALGREAVKVGAKPVTPEQVSDDVEYRLEVVDTTLAILRRLAPELSRRQDTFVGVGMVLQAIGLYAHQSLSVAGAKLSRSDMLLQLGNVNWSKSLDAWQALGAVPTASGGLKLVQNAAGVGKIANALMEPRSSAGRKLRSR